MKDILEKLKFSEQLDYVVETLRIESSHIDDSLFQLEDKLKFFRKWKDVFDFLEHQSDHKHRMPVEWVQKIVSAMEKGYRVQAIKHLRQFFMDTRNGELTLREAKDEVERVYYFHGGMGHWLVNRWVFREIIILDEI